MYLLFDIGGTNMRLAAASGNKILRIKKSATPSDFRDAMTIFSQLAGELSRGQLWEGAAGCTPGPLDAKLTKMVSAPNLPGWNNKPLKKTLEQILKCEVFIMKDVSAAVLGEANFGAGKGKRIVAYFTVSTGVGGARAINGQVDETTAWAEPGYQIIKPDDPYGFIEGLVSGTGLKRQYKKEAADIKDKRVWADAARLLAVGVHNTIVHWQPDVVVIGGSVMKKLPIDKVRQEVKRILKIYKKPPLIKRAVLGDMVGLYGALARLNLDK
ncbi:MAG: ROK family protein [Planctomycetes bacterium]|jgi:glucokinase|nr:ROK family protein [Planctomycetota bacterium]